MANLSITDWYSDYMARCSGNWRYAELASAALWGYKREVDAGKFLLAVQDYMIAVRNGAKKPAALFLIMRRAKQHGCDVELRELLDDYEIERIIYLHHANEGLDEFERNMRGKM